MFNFYFTYTMYYHIFDENFFIFFISIKPIIPSKMYMIRVNWVIICIFGPWAQKRINDSSFRRKRRHKSNLPLSNHIWVFWGDWRHLIAQNNILVFEGVLGIFYYYSFWIPRVSWTWGSIYTNFSQGFRVIIPIFIQ